MQGLADDPCVSASMFVLSGCNLGFLWEWSCSRQLEPPAFHGSRARSLCNTGFLPCCRCPHLTSATSCGPRPPFLSGGPRTWSCDSSAGRSQHLACPTLLATVWHPTALSPSFSHPWLFMMKPCQLKKVLYSLCSLGSSIASAFSTTSYLEITACLEDSPNPRIKSTQIR